MEEKAQGPPFIDPRAFGAKGDGKTKDTAAIQKAIDRCAAAGGGTVCLGPGRYLTAPIHLASHVTLHLDAGAVILGSRDKRDYGIVRLRCAGNEGLTLEALINGSDLENVAVTGRGAIDGQGSIWWESLREYLETPKERRPTWPDRDTEDFVRVAPGIRPCLVELVNCRDIVFDGFTLRNSGFWTLHPIFCENVKIHGLTILNPDHSYNTDGINPDSCRNVRISDCLISVGDDCITLKSGADDAARARPVPCENINITNCTMLDGHGGVVIGSDCAGGVRNVTASNCVFQGTEMGIRIKSMRGRGGVVENIAVNNIVMEKVGRALVMNMHYWRETSPEPVSERTPRFRDIRISQIHAVDCESAGFFHGLEEMPIRGVVIDGLHMTAKEGLRMQHCEDIELRGVCLDAEEGPGLACEDVADLRIDGFRRRDRGAPASLIRVARSRDVSISGCAQSVVEVEGGAEGQVSFGG